MKKHTHVWILQTCVFSTSHTFVFGMCLVKATYVWFVPLHKNANRQCFFFTHVCFHTCGYIRWKQNSFFPHMFGFLQICLEQAKHVCKLAHICILADGWLLPIMYGKHQTRWYIYTWVLFPHMFRFWHIHVYTGKGTHVWKKPHN